MTEEYLANGKRLVWAPMPGAQTALLLCDIEDVFWGGARAAGKGLSASTGMVLTPFGFRQISAIEVGDSVCAIDGTVTKVIGVYRRGVQPLYRCYFSDGSTIEVDGDHIWQGWRVNQTVKKANERTSGEAASRKYTMRDLLGFVGTERDRAEYATNRLAIPVTEPVRFNVNGQLVGKSNFVGRDALHPYVLGVVLGDGCITDGTTIRFCSADDEIPARVASLLPDCDAMLGPYAYDGRSAKGYSINSPGAVRLLDQLGLMGKYSWEKSIPRIYKMATVEERWELLRGLMDTDGWADADGDIYYCTTSRKLADDVRELAWSLGAVVSVSEKEPTYTYNGQTLNGRTAWTLRLKFRDNAMAFTLSRKKDRCTGKEYQSFARYMERIEYIGDGESICIEVAHSSSLFIANDYLVTHNTEAVIGAWLQHMVQYGQNVRGLYFRKSFPEMQQVWSRMVEVYEPTGAKSNRSDWTFTWPGGANLTLKYLENDDDAARCMGFSTTMHVYDEAGQWAEPGPIDKLYATLRSPHGIPCIRRLTGNPGGPGTQWLKERYVDPSPPLVPFRWAPNKDRPDLTIESVFIPATLDQNIILKAKDPGYEARLAGTGDSELFKAWRYGDWNVLAGRYFGSFKESRNVVEPMALSPWYTRWIAIDYGFAHDAAAVWCAYDGSTIHVYRELSANELTVPELCAAIVSMTGRDEQIQSVFLSPDAANRRSSPRTIEQEMRENLPWTLRRADNDRIGGWSLMQSMFKFGTLKIFSDCKRLIKWLGTAQRDPKRPEDVMKRDGDDLGDALRYAIKTSEVMPVVPPEVLYEQRIKPHIDAGNGFKAMIERFKMDEELRKVGQPLTPRGKRRR